MTDSTENTGLTMQQIRALRSESTLRFIGATDGTGVIEATRTVDDGGIFGKRDVSAIVCQCVAFIPHAKAGTQAAFTLRDAQEERWQTVAQGLRAGDTLELVFTRGALSNPVLNTNGLAGDALDVVQVRERERGLGRLTFRVGEWIGKADSEKRMIRAK